MLSQTTEYALRAMVFLAQRPKEAVARHEIARTTKVPGDYLAKVMRSLAEAGLVRAGRGPSGGFCLSRESSDITILDVVNAVDPICRIETCPLGLAGHRHTLCPLHAKMDAAIAQIESAFRDTPLSDLVKPGMGHVQPLCDSELITVGARSI